ncbi:hypothetical protein TNCV_2948241 [Trichonephila clavipes]|nr:hypothetical protein TNCV_2948241 [Trichonephila clavipes]
MPQQLIDTLILSMGRRCETCLAWFRASDSRPEDLGLMPDASKYPPSTHGVRARYIIGSVVLWAESRAQGLENIFVPFSFHAEIVEVDIGGVTIYRPFG